MNENIIKFKLESKNDSRIYLNGGVDINTIDDTDGGDWNYEQNDGTYNNHIPSYWKTFNEDLSDNFHEFLDIIDWEDFQQTLWDYQDENLTVDCGKYLLHINDKV